MKKNASRKPLTLAALTLALASVGNAATTVTVDPSAMTLGHMNVFNLPNSGTWPTSPLGAYQYGSAWGLADLVSAYSMDPSSTTNIVTLGPNLMPNPDSYWYIGGGADGN